MEVDNFQETIPSKLSNMPELDQLNFIRIHQQQIKKTLSNETKNYLTTLLCRISDLRLKVLICQILDIKQPNLPLIKCATFFDYKNSEIIHQQLLKVIFILYFVSFCGVNSEIVNSSTIEFQESDHFFKISTVLYDKNTFMLSENYHLKNFTNLSSNLKSFRNNIQNFKEFNEQNYFCYSFNDETNMKNITDVALILGNKTRQNYIYSLNHIERNTANKQFVSYALNNRCYYTYSLPALGKLKSFELNPKLLLKDVNSTYFENNIFSQNTLTKETNCINYGMVSQKSNRIVGYYMRKSKLAGCIRKCLSTVNCRIYEYNFVTTGCQLFRQNSNVIWGRIDMKPITVGKVECRLIYDQYDPSLLYQKSLQNINGYCNFTENFHQIKYNCLDYYNFLDKPLKDLEIKSQEFLLQIHKNFDFEKKSQKQKRNTSFFPQVLKYAPQIIMKMIESQQISEVINVKKYLGIFKDVSLQKIRDWFRQIGIHSSLSKENNFISLNLYSQMENQFYLEPFNHKLYHFFKNLKNLQNSIFSEMGVILNGLNYPNKTGKFLPENFVFNRYINEDKIQSMFIYQNYSIGTERDVLLIPKSNWENTDNWQTGILNKNSSNSRCIINALTQTITRNCKKPQSIKILQQDIFYVTINKNKFRIAILLVNKKGIIQLSCQNSNRIFTINQLYILAFDLSCDVYFNNMNLLKAQTFENYIKPRILHTGKFLQRTDLLFNTTQIFNKHLFEQLVGKEITSKLAQQLLSGLNLNTTDLIQYCCIGFMFIAYFMKMIYFQYFPKMKKNNKEKKIVCGIEESMPLKSMPLKTFSSLRNKP